MSSLHVGDSGDKIIVNATPQVSDSTSHYVEQGRKAADAILDFSKAACDEFAFRAKQSLADADHAIRQHPYHWLGACAGIGLILGLLINRR
jgi:ElaB/YqjD/DUF883 family membrane-anchored ribosome-binding protein